MGKLPPYDRRKHKQKLLKRAIAEGRGDKMIKTLNQVHLRSKPTPEEQKVLDDIKLEVDQPRSVRMLNTIARQAGISLRYIQDLFSNHDDPDKTIH